ncbi:hypothetical protein LTR36_009279 [Oleoguttula mirabilis]|uniref:AAA+ ATPase lid domain-containing protein n=1 Tax=Oleoguttula mirabilis TaxID=1507867 RepID=A0AAV9J6J3_9PEZI|nr:hypothetical protein LTR36_009279 [Oleoguttula mirabilis]
MRIAQPTKDYIREDKDLLALEWNAREIRSAFQTAVALAEVEGPKRQGDRTAVTAEHIKTVVTMSKHFKDYLKDLYQKSQDERAANMLLRNDISRSGAGGDVGAQPY